MEKKVSNDSAASAKMPVISLDNFLILLLLVTCICCTSRTEATDRSKNATSSNCINWSDSLEQVLNSEPELFIHSIKDDNCLLDFVSTAANQAIASGDSKYLIALNSLCEASDGYLSEGIGGAIAEAFEKEPLILIRFFVGVDGKSCLQRLLIDEISATIAVVPKEERQARIEDYRLRISRELGLKTDDKTLIKFLETAIIGQIDPAKFD